MNHVFSLENIAEVAKHFWNYIEHGGIRIFGFSGNLGAGKTTFTKKLLEHAGHTGSVPSPTFVLRRDYKANNGKNIIHIDAYRLEVPEQLFQVISEKELNDENNIVIIEWPEKVDEKIFHEVYVFEHIDENTRKVSKR
jgi:tRNA threonylcarbamoyladenosine biosynthesis protein TsaE